jgi:hypothetical protein
MAGRQREIRRLCVAPVRCTEDVVETLAGRPVSAAMAASFGEPAGTVYPGEY